MGSYTRQSTFVPYSLGDANAVELEFDGVVANLNARVDKDGSVPIEAEFELDCTSPSVLFSPTESNGEQFRIKEIVDGGTSALYFQTYEGAAWIDVFVLVHDKGSAWSDLFDLKIENMRVRDTTPYIQWEGTEIDGETFRIKEDAGDWKFEVYDTGTSAYVPAITIDNTGGVTLDQGLYVSSVNTNTSGTLSGTYGPYTKSFGGNTTFIISYDYAAGDIPGTTPLYLTISDRIITSPGYLIVGVEYSWYLSNLNYRIRAVLDIEWTTAMTFQFDYTLHIPQEV